MGWLLVGLISCEKDIDIDYRSVEPIYVVEASVSGNGMKARVSMTQDMDDNRTTSDVTAAYVVVTAVVVGVIPASAIDAVDAST